MKTTLQWVKNQHAMESGLVEMMSAGR